MKPIKDKVWQYQFKNEIEGIILKYIPLEIIWKVQDGIQSLVWDLVDNKVQNQIEDKLRINYESN